MIRMTMNDYEWLMKGFFDHVCAIYVVFPLSAVEMVGEEKRRKT